MTIVNGYASLPEVKAAIGVDDAETDDDPVIEMAASAASRHLEDHAGRGRKFWLDTTAVARQFWPSEPDRVWVNDIGSTANLVVKVDDSGDGTFATTLTINTDFILEPVNAAADGRAYESIRRIDGGFFPCSSYGRPTVQVTAMYGWPTVPVQIKEACILQAKQIFKSADTTFGAFQAGVDGFARWVPALDPMARAQLEGFVRRTPVDDEYPDA